MKKWRNPSNLIVVLIYLLVGGGWVLFSDRIAEKIFNNPELLATVKAYKDWIFVAASTALLYSATWSKKSAQKALEKSYRMLVENLPAVVFMDKFDKNQSTQYISPRIKDLVGYTKEEWQAADNMWASCLHPDDKERVLREDARTNQTGEPFNIEYRLRHRNGHYVWIRENAAVIRDEDGVPLFWQGILSDITSQKEAEEATQRQLKELSILHSVALAESTAESVDDLIQRITIIIGNTLYPDNCGVLLLNESKSELIPHPSYRGIGEEKRISVPITKGVAGKVAATGQSVLLRDVTQEPSYHKVTSDIKSELCVPIRDEAGVIGVINVESKELDAFSESDERLLNTIANNVANFIKKNQLFTENARLFQEEKRRSNIIEALANIASEVANTQEFEPALDKIAQLSLSLLNASSFAVYLLQDNNQTIKIVSAQGEYQQELLSHTINLGEGVTGNIIANGMPEIIEDMAKDSRRKTVPGTPEDDKDHDTMMSAPLIQYGKPIGSVNAWRKKASGVFDKSELNFLVNIAHQTSITIESARLLQSYARREREAAAIAKVGRDISATLQLNVVLEQIAVYAKDLLKSSTSAVYLAEPDTPFLRAIAALGVDSEEIKNDPVKQGEGILGNIALNRLGEIVNNIVEDPRSVTVKGTVIDPHEHIMGVPVFSKDELTGLLVVWRTGEDNKFQASDLNFLSSLAQQAAVAIQNARLFELEQKRREEAEIIRLATTALTNLLDIPSLYSAIFDWLYKIRPYDSASILEIEEEGLRLTAARGIPNITEQLGMLFPLDNALCKVINETGKPLIIDDCLKDPRFKKWSGTDYVRGWIGVPMISRGQVIGYINMDSRTPGAFTKNDASIAQTFAHQAATSLDNIRHFTETQQRLSELEIISRISSSLRAARITEDMFPILLTEIKSSMNTDSAAIWLYNSEKNELEAKCSSGQLSTLSKSTFKPGEGIIGKVYSSGVSHVSDKFFADPMGADTKLLFPAHQRNASTKTPRKKYSNKSTYIYGYITAIPKELNIFEKKSQGIIVPIRTTSETIGALAVAVHVPRKIETHHIRLITTIAEIAGNAIYRSNLYERSEQQISQLTALRELDTAIVSNLDLENTLGILVDYMLAKMGVDAASVLVFNPNSQMLEYCAANGFNNRSPLRTPIGIGDELTSKILLSRQTHYLSNIKAENNPRIKNMVTTEQFTSYYAVPLFSKSATRGILETYFRTPFSPTTDWEDFMRALARQATIAIDNAQLFENLEHSNKELNLAYDITLEGWGKALELRDKETEGHTRRVTDLALELAREMKIPETELIHIRRGALLHDIGKMGVPDNILRKKGPLTKKETVEMHKHPQYAYDLLSPIKYLRTAIDIAYCHHEWWNGSGYPRELKGTEIPLSARIFALVDVWDALLSDRPYRPAWTIKKTLNYIKGLSGKQFDPEIVDVFCKMVANKTSIKKKKTDKKMR